MDKGRSLNIRNVPVDLVSRVKVAAAMDRMNMREWVLEAIKAKLDGGSKSGGRA